MNVYLPPNKTLFMKVVHLLAALLIGMGAQAQTTSLPLWDKGNAFLDRLEIKLQNNNDLNLSTVKPYLRKPVVAVADSVRAGILAGTDSFGLTRVDMYNLNRFQANNKEYSRYTMEDFPDWKAKWSMGNHIYPTKGNLLEVNEPNFYLSVNPVFGGQLGKDSDKDATTFINSKGVTFRGLLAKKVGFDFYVTDNQERGPVQFDAMVAKNNAVPGAGFFKTFKNGGYDYFDTRGSIYTNVTKFINVQFGFDKQFIGNGYRSMFLSDFSNNALFLKLNTRFWRINYTNLYMELFPYPGSNRIGNVLSKKYATMHHLGINITRWLNVGLFEGVVFGRPNRYEFSYLLPVIFLRGIEGNNGSPDNANIGIDLKVNFLKSFQFYTQLMLDELNIKEIRKDKTWWANKTGFQAGLKYIDVAGIDNLDLRLEYNRVRPFTYSHFDSVASYTHYKQPLAHPLGANFNEYLAVLRYQPMNKLYAEAKIISYKQGLDSINPVGIQNTNFGFNPNRTYDNGRGSSYGYVIGGGIPAKTLYGSLWIGYELFENCFLEAGAMARKASVNGVDKNNMMFSIGLKLNTFRREYDY